MSTLTSFKTINFYHEDSMRYGVNAAIVLYHIRFWVSINKQNYLNDPERNMYVKEGRVWTKGSIRSLQELRFDFLSAPQVREAIDKLVAMGALIKGCFNDYKYDRSSWYSINDDDALITKIEDKSTLDQDQAHVRPDSNELDPTLKSYKDSTIKEDKNKKRNNNIYTDFKKSDSTSLDLLKHWNDKSIIKHSEHILLLKDIDKILKKKNISLEAAKMAIDNYKRVLDLKGWFTYKWGLKDFLKRGFDRFEQDSFVTDNYIVKNTKVIKDESLNNAIKEQMHEDIANSMDSMELKIDYFQSQGMTYDESTRFFSRVKSPKRELWDNFLRKREGTDTL